MSRPVRLKLATSFAEKVLRDLGISGLPVDPIEIAERKNIVVEAKPDTEPGVSGMLLRYGDTFGIAYATHIASVGFQRFCVAHELGHYFLEGHIDHVLPKGGAHASRAGFVSADPYELEADHFAAGLLMPETAFKREVRKRPAGLGAVEELSDLCITSRTASAIRFAELTDDAVAVIVSTGRHIDYCFLSSAMKTLPKLSWLRKGTTIPAGTLTCGLAADPARVKAGEKDSDEIDVRDWLGGERAARVSEEVIGLGTYGKCLTILSSPTIGQEDLDDPGDDDEEIENSWTPRFRR